MRATTVGRSRRFKGLAVMAAAAAIVVAACGSDDDDGTSGDPADTGAVDVPSTDEPPPDDSTATDESTSPSAPAGDGGVDMDALVAAAQEEGRVVFYSASTEEINQAVAAAFTEKYGIEVEVLRAATTALLERFISEQDANVHTADVLNSADPSVFEDRPELFVPMSEETIPGFDAYPEGFKTEHYAIVNVSPYVVTYNTDQVAPEDVPQSWEDVLNPVFDGRTLLTDPRATPNWMYWAWSRQQYLGDDFLTGIRDLDFDLVDSASPGAQQVAAGAYAINYPAVAAHSAALRAEGAPVGIALLPDESSGTVQTINAVATAEHPNAALLFVAFHMSTEGLQASCSQAEIGSPDPAATNCVELPEGWTAPDLSKIRDEAVQSNILSLLGIS